LQMWIFKGLLSSTTGISQITSYFQTVCCCCLLICRSGPFRHSSVCWPMIMNGTPV